MLPTLEVRDGEEIVFSLSADIALMPTDELERAAVFTALSNSLALLCGLKPQSATASKEALPPERDLESGRCRADQKPGAVLHLRERLGSGTQTTRRQLSGEPQGDCEEYGPGHRSPQT
jgi:hypothetical protein